jgi:hypothetical protein
VKLSVPPKEKEKPFNTTDQRASSTAKTLIVCRICRRNHFTVKCALMRSLSPTENPASSVAATTVTSGDSAATYAEPIQFYIPPSLYAKPAGSTDRNNNEYSTLRVTNISVEIIEDILYHLFRGSALLFGFILQKTESPMSRKALRLFLMFRNKILLEIWNK